MLVSPKDDDLQNDASALLTFWKQYQYARRCPCERCSRWLLKISNDDIQFAEQIFVSEMFKGNYHLPHTHPGSILSGILYLQTPEGSSPLIIKDPRSFRDYYNFRKIPGDFMTNKEQIAILPKKGLFIMFESWLNHVVPETSNENEGRITMVFNIARKYA